MDKTSNLESHSMSDRFPLTSSSINILCVDDEPNILSALKRMFALAGFSLTCAESGKQALDLIQSQTFHMIISDMRMPNMSGVELFEQIKTTHSELIKILLTGYSDLDSAIAAVNRGEVYRYLTKPWNESEIIATVESGIEYLNLKAEKARLLAITQAQNVQLNELVATLEEKVQDRTQNLTLANQRLKDSYFSSIKSFSNLLDLRHMKLLDHSKLVADLSMKIGISMNLDSEVCQELFISGLLHDIGKIGLSDRALATKVFNLPQSDLDLYKAHTTMGSSCLKGLDGMKIISENIKYHHERFDGNGYPEGLKGEKIPLGARILGLVETYFELLEGDLTQTNKSSVEAQTIVLRYKNSAFDPDVVDHFLKVLNVQQRPSVQTDYQINVKETTKTSRPVTSSTASVSPDTTYPKPMNAKELQTQNLRPGKGQETLKKIFTLQSLYSIVGRFEQALIIDRRDEEGGFLWVKTGVKKFNPNSELDKWLKSNRFLYSESEAAWYFPFD